MLKINKKMRKKIIHIADNKYILKLVKEILGRDYDYFPVISGKEGLNLLKKEGVVDDITKPFKAKDFKNKIDAILK